MGLFDFLFKKDSTIVVNEKKSRIFYVEKLALPTLYINSGIGEPIEADLYAKHISKYIFLLMDEGNSVSQIVNLLENNLTISKSNAEEMVKISKLVYDTTKDKSSLTETDPKVLSNEITQLLIDLKIAGKSNEEVAEVAIQMGLDSNTAKSLAYNAEQAAEAKSYLDRIKQNQSKFESNTPKTVTYFKSDYIETPIIVDLPELVNFKTKTGINFYSTKSQELILSKGKEVEDAYMWFEDNCVPAVKNNKWGIINQEGNFIVDVVYDKIGVNGGGLYSAEKDGKYGYIDKNGKVKIPLKFSPFSGFWLQSHFCDGVSRIQTGEKKYAFINVNGEIISENFEYSSSNDMELNTNDDRIRVCKNGKYGYIDTKGKLIIDYRFSFASNFDEGVACVSEENSNDYYINIYGDKIYGYFRQGTKFTAGLALIKKAEWGRVSCIDKNGNIIFDVENDDIRRVYPFSNGLAMIERYTKGNSIYGFIDKVGNLTIPYIYGYAESFANGLAKVDSEGYNSEKSTFINRDGKIVLERPYFMSDFGNRGLGTVHIKGQPVMITDYKGFDYWEK